MLYDHLIMIIIGLDLYLLFRVDLFKKKFIWSLISVLTLISVDLLSRGRYIEPFWTEKMRRMLTIWAILGCLRPSADLNFLDFA